MLLELNELHHVMLGANLGMTADDGISAWAFPFYSRIVTAADVIADDIEAGDGKLIDVQLHRNHVKAELCYIDRLDNIAVLWRPDRNDYPDHFRDFYEASGEFPTLLCRSPRYGRQDAWMLTSHGLVKGDAWSEETGSTLVSFRGDKFIPSTSILEGKPRYLPSPLPSPADHGRAIVDGEGNLIGMVDGMTAHESTDGKQCWSGPRVPQLVPEGFCDFLKANE